MSRNTLYNATILFCVGMCVCILQYAMADYISLRIVSILLYCCLSIGLVRGRLAHPVVWLVPFLFLYQFSHIILSEWGYANASDPSGVVWVGWFAIWSFTISSVLCCRSDKITSVDTSSLRTIGCGSLAKWFFRGSLVASVAYLVWFYASGVGTKADWSRMDMLDLQFVFGLMLLSYSIRLVATVFLRGERPWGMVVSMVVVSILILVVAGERDVLLRAVLVTGFVLYYVYRPSLSMTAAFAGLAVGTIPILGRLKNMLVKTEVVGDIVRTDSLFVDIFRGEFQSAGRNIDILLSSDSSWSLFYGQTFLWDFARTIVPAPLMYVQNASGWYMSTFHSAVSAQGRGYGFTLAGEGFINFGLPGVALVYIAVGAFVGVLYNLARRNGLAGVVYLVMVPIIIYSTRGDLSVIASPFLKQVIAPLFMLWIGTRLLRRR